MRSTHRGLGSVILVCLFLSSVSAQDESRTRPPAASNDAALRALVEEFYGSYAKKDLDGFLRLWSAKSPELAARRETMQKLFVDNEKIEVKGLVIRKLAVEGEKAKLRVELEMGAIEVKTGKPAAGFGKDDSRAGRSERRRGLESLARGAGRGRSCRRAGIAQNRR